MKWSYVIAFGADGCCDVTRRYVRNPAKHGLPRTRCLEGVLVHILREINARLRSNMDKKQKFQLHGDDEREDAELRKLFVEALALRISALRPRGDKNKARVNGDDADARKAAEAASENPAATRRSQNPRQQHEQHEQHDQPR